MQKNVNCLRLPWFTPLTILSTRQIKSASGALKERERTGCQIGFGRKKVTSSQSSFRAVLIRPTVTLIRQFQNSEMQITKFLFWEASSLTMEKLSPILAKIRVTSKNLIFTFKAPNLTFLFYDFHLLKHIISFIFHICFLS